MLGNNYCTPVRQRYGDHLPGTVFRERDVPGSGGLEHLKAGHSPDGRQGLPTGLAGSKSDVYAGPAVGTRTSGAVGRLTAEVTDIIGRNRPLAMTVTNHHGAGTSGGLHSSTHNVASESQGARAPTYDVQAACDDGAAMSQLSSELALPPGWGGVALRVGLAGLRVSLWVSPRPTAWVIRQLFVQTGKQMAAKLARESPPNVSAVINESYEHSPHGRLDVYTPGGATSSLPTVVWTHGGAFVGGSKDEIGDYLRMIAASGLTVVGVEYSLAPSAIYPTPVRQVMAALLHLQANADRLHVDPDRIILAGDSAGAHITAQVAAVVTNPDYGRQIGVDSTIEATQLGAVALCCGVYNFVTLINPDSAFKDIVGAVGWAYSGIREYQKDEAFVSSTTLTRHVTEAFPPTFITAGNADPLEAQSRAMVNALQSKGTSVETLLFPHDHHPALGHEYQFDVGLADGRAALERLITFFHGAHRGVNNDDGQAIQ
jgi:acetyl esterase/lipase